MSIRVTNLPLHWLIGIVNSISNTAMLNQLEESLSCASHPLGNHLLYSSHFYILPRTNMGIENRIKSILIIVIRVARCGGGQHTRLSSYKYTPYFNFHYHNSHFHNFHVLNFQYQNFHFHKCLQVWRRAGYPTHFNFHFQNFHVLNFHKVWRRGVSPTLPSRPPPLSTCTASDLILEG